MSEWEELSLEKGRTDSAFFAQKLVSGVGDQNEHRTSNVQHRMLNGKNGEPGIHSHAGAWEREFERCEIIDIL